MDLRKEIAEAVGTFTLVFAGAGAIVVDAKTHLLGHVGVSLVFGLVVLGAVYMLGRVSGAHINPAVTVAFAVTGHFPWHRVAPYIVAQLIGATAAALLLRMLVGPVAQVGATSLTGVGTTQGFLLEVAGTFVLASVIIRVATDPRAARVAAASAIGGAVALGAFLTGPFTGGSMNPARSIGPALANSTWPHLWLYVAAPLLGAVAAMVLFEATRPDRRPVRQQSTGPLADLDDPVGKETS